MFCGSSFVLLYYFKLREAEGLGLFKLGNKLPSVFAGVSAELVDLTADAGKCGAADAVLTVKIVNGQSAAS